MSLHADRQIVWRETHGQFPDVPNTLVPSTRRNDLGHFRLSSYHEDENLGTDPESKTLTYAPVEHPSHLQYLSQEDEVPDTMKRDWPLGGGSAHLESQH